MSNRILSGEAARACEEFFLKFPDYAQIIWDGIEVVLHLPGSNEPFVEGEYHLGTETRLAFERLFEAFSEEKPFEWWNTKIRYAQCAHPDHNDKETCEERAVGCSADCRCCAPPWQPQECSCGACILCGIPPDLGKQR